MLNGVCEGFNFLLTSFLLRLIAAVSKWQQSLASRSRHRFTYFEVMFSMSLPNLLMGTSVRGAALINFLSAAGSSVFASN